MSENKDGKNIVVMHNQLARHTILEKLTSLSVQDQRVIAYLIATGIKNHANAELPAEVEGSVADLAQVCGMSMGGDIYTATRAATESLMKHVIRFKHPDDGHDVSSVWLSEGHYYVTEGRFRCAFPPTLRQVLTDLHKHRTEFELETLLGLGGGAYALRLYQVLKSWESAKGFITSIETLRGQLGVPAEAYSRVNDFQRYCLDYPLKSINEKSDIRVTYAKHGRGRRLTHLAFTIQPRKRGGMKRASVIDRNNPHQIDDLPEAEQGQAWEWLRTLAIGEDLTEIMDWSKLPKHASKEQVLRLWIAEKDQQKFPFAKFPDSVHSER